MMQQEVYTTTHDIVLPKKKKSSLNLAKPLDLTTNLQEIQEWEEFVNTTVMQIAKVKF